MAALFVSVLTIVSTSVNNENNIVIEIEGNRFFSSDFLLARYKSIKNHSDMEKLIRKILDEYSNAGFAFCSVRPELIDVDSVTKKLILHISEGERIMIKANRPCLEESIFLSRKTQSDKKGNSKDQCFPQYLRIYYQKPR
ncbi:MAG: hypothetical protein ABIL22_02140 [candidate division WOR-3 bacterium]